MSVVMGKNIDLLGPRLLSEKNTPAQATGNTWDWYKPDLKEMLTEGIVNTQLIGVFSMSSIP